MQLKNVVVKLPRIQKPQGRNCVIQRFVVSFWVRSKLLYSSTHFEMMWQFVLKYFSIYGQQ